MKIRKNLIIPFIIILILGLYLMLNRTGKMNYTIPEFDSLDSQSISIIEVIGKDENIKLYSDNGTWRISEGNLKAETSKVNDMLAFLGKPEFIDMVSESENYQNYGLHEDIYTIVKAYTANNSSGSPDREFYFGDLNTSGNFVYIRSPESKAVYTARGNVKGIFSTSNEDMLNKKIMDINPGDIDKIELIFPENKAVLQKSVDSNNNDEWQSNEGHSLNNKSVEQSINYLANSRFESYISSEELFEDKKTFEIILHENGNISNFIIFNQGDAGYYASSSFTDKEFLLSGNTGTQIIKMFTEIIQSKGD